MLYHRTKVDDITVPWLYNIFT